MFINIKICNFLAFSLNIYHFCCLTIIIVLKILIIHLQKCNWPNNVLFNIPKLNLFYQSYQNWWISTIRRKIKYFHQKNKTSYSNCIHNFCCTLFCFPAILGNDLLVWILFSLKISPSFWWPDYKSFNASFNNSREKDIFLYHVLTFLWGCVVYLHF